MEGLLDHSLRDAITRAGGIDLCVSEFIRITDQLLPERVFTRIVPELLNASRTPAGTPVRAQLLGSDPGCMAENAARLAALGPAGIDLNFGCPAPTVNRHRGGAVLLDEPELVHAIVAAVRRAVPAGMPVSAKMRLGNLEESRLLENAHAIEDGGASELVVHARTRSQGYRPPAFWDRIARVRAAVRLTVVANGEIWSVEDALRCRAESGCTDLMLGRGAVADPGLARRLGGGAPLAWSELLPLVEGYWQHIGRREAAPVAPRHRAGRLKQWLNLLRRRYPEAEVAYQAVRTINEPGAVAARMFGSACGPTPPAPQALAAATA
ncbi:MAG: tRNA-dihydrouridine synthase [Burkholderiales bacterium]|nr:tRNA-dihydrouridine synthase [Burkholderiales bacterium]MDE2396641.1 tRNA-dihydrouridine synthase [Burkholderiales bacterium]MDE2457372.1 tRNA-dihydrouridine synthase [Burkholderiales bacterium]